MEPLGCLLNLEVVLLGIDRTEIGESIGGEWHGVCPYKLRAKLAVQVLSYLPGFPRKVLRRKYSSEINQVEPFVGAVVTFDIHRSVD